MTANTKQAKDYLAAIHAARQDEVKRAVAAAVARLRADEAAGITYPGFPGDADLPIADTSEAPRSKIADFCLAPVLVSEWDARKPAPPVTETDAGASADPFLPQPTKDAPLSDEDRKH